MVEKISGIKILWLIFLIIIIALRFLNLDTALLLNSI
jgi:hypothetical protein